MVWQIRCIRLTNSTIANYCFWFFYDDGSFRSLRMHNSRGSHCSHWIRFGLKTDRDRDDRLLHCERKAKNGRPILVIHEALTFEKTLACYLICSVLLSLACCILVISLTTRTRISMFSLKKRRSKKYHIYIFCQSPSSSLSSSSLLMSSLSRCQDISLHHSESLFCLLYRANSSLFIFAVKITEVNFLISKFYNIGIEWQKSLAIVGFLIAFWGKKYNWLSPSCFSLLFQNDHDHCLALELVLKSNSEMDHSKQFTSIQWCKKDYF